MSTNTLYLIYKQLPGILTFGKPGLCASCGKDKYIVLDTGPKPWLKETGQYFCYYCPSACCEWVSFRDAKLEYRNSSVSTMKNAMVEDVKRRWPEDMIQHLEKARRYVDDWRGVDFYTHYKTSALYRIQGSSLLFLTQS